MRDALRTALLFTSLLSFAAPSAPAAELSNSGVWGTKAPLLMHRQEAAITAIGGKIYVIAGNRTPEETATGDQRNNSTRVDEYDPKTDRWRERAPIPRGTNHVWAAAIGGKIYTIGGFQVSNKNGTHDVFEYDPKTDKWRERAPLPNPARGSVGLALLDGKIHVIGGRDTDTSFETHQVYDPRHDSWSVAADLPQGHGRDHLSAIATIGGQIHVIGGRFAASDKMTDLHDVYDAKTDRWHEEPKMPTARSGGPGAVYHGLIIVMGGERPGGPMYDQTEAYDPVARKWLILAKMPGGRHATGAVVIGDTLYIPGGGPQPGGGDPTNTLLTFNLPKGVHATTR